MSNTPSATSCKVGDSNDWDGHSWYFCDCPNHKEHIKWHTHSTKSCHTHQHWLASKSTDATAAVMDDATATTTEDTTGLLSLTSATNSNPTDISALLASALSLASSSGNTQN